MTLRAEINGVNYSGFKDYKVNRSVEHLSSDYTLTLSNEGNRGLPFQRGANIVIYANNVPVLTGFIEDLKVNYSKDDHDITFGGRSKVCDLIDSTIGHKIEIKGPVTLEQIIAKVMKEINMTGVGIINNAGPLKPFTDKEIVAGTVDQHIFDFLEQYTKKRQVLMTNDGLGNVVLARAGTEHAATSLIQYIDKELGNKYNNIKSADVSFDDSQRYYLYRAFGQGNPAAGAASGTSNNENLTNRIGQAIDPEIRTTRILDITAESTSDIPTLNERCKWEANIRRARSIEYCATVQGHVMTNNGKPWEPNMLVSVKDEMALIDSSLLIKDVNYSLDLSGGSITKLTLVHPDSFLPEPVLSNSKKKKSKIGFKNRGSTDGAYVQN